jgi:hypothetical protein
MALGKLTISIDLELAWGFWDKLTAENLRMAETAERPICAALIELFDRYQVPATWAIVAALLDEKSGKSRSGASACWYAPDIVEGIVKAKVGHEIASHSGKHVYFCDITAAQAREDLDFMRAVHRAHTLPHRSFVYPRNAIGHLNLIAQAGLQTFRGPDVGWFRIARRAGRTPARAANFVDKFLPIPPSPVSAQTCGELIDIPGSMLLLGRNGARRFVLPAVTRAKLRMGLARAQRTGETFHLWFHPSNFYHRRDEQLATLSWFLDHAASEAGRGHIEICTMGSYVGKVATDTAAPTLFPA